ncbi:MAG: SDR family NAD(P)-dependent oxidoreductase [Candidatus Nanopelagicales bacterium]
MTERPVTLVTGSASGIGRVTALHLASLGHDVVCTDLPVDALDETAAMTAGLAVAADVTSEAEVAVLGNRIRDAHGRLDGVVHCAGVEEDFIDADEMPLATFERTMRINVTGSFLVAQAAARIMIPRRTGSIVLLGSILSTVAYGRNAAYTASKGAVLQLGKALAVDWARHGIRVNVVGPGPVATPMSQETIDDPERGTWLLERIPLGRPAEAIDVAHVCAFLLSPASGYMTGAYLPVDGGWLAL